MERNLDEEFKRWKEEKKKKLCSKCGMRKNADWLGRVCPECGHTIGKVCPKCGQINEVV